MTDRNLGGLQVAVLLVSASYGIGFLFGSGELALRHGMAGSIYGVATAAGMFILAFVGRRLWVGGVPVWEWFGRAYGLRLQRAVALLSVVWMAGVLAAQIHGGAAVAGETPQAVGTVAASRSATSGGSFIGGSSVRGVGSSRGGGLGVRGAAAAPAVRPP